MALLIRGFFAFWYGTILTYQFANVKKNAKTILKMWAFFFISTFLQLWTENLGGKLTAEQLYPFTTHLPLILWLIFLHKVNWEICVGSVITAYLCCELPNWVSQFAAIPFGSDYNVQVVIYCISSILILILLSRYLVPSIQALFGKSRSTCLLFTAIPFLYYLWCYVTTVYTSYLRQYGYEVAFTMSALFTLLFLIFAVSQSKHQDDAALMKELEQSKKEAILANQAKGDFLARMSHEIRTPINSVLGIDEMILRECDDPQIIDYASKIKTSGQTLLQLINDILDISKIESNKMEITLVEYEPKKLLSEVLLLIEPRASAKGLKLYCEFDSHIPCKLYGDDMRIRQVLINLLTNAVKYTKEGKITFTVQLIQKNEESALLHFSVKDTGIGIKEEDHSLLYESFQRLDISKNKGIEGTGLGLSITHKLLQLMNSNLQLKSVYGVGSDFHFTLKQNIADSCEMGNYQKEMLLSPTDIYHEGFYAPTAKVLVVDDNHINLVVFKGLLKNSGMHIQTAMSAKEALEFIRNESYDLVFMDHMMPGMDGIEALHHILADEHLHLHAQIIIALTANAITGAKEYYLQEGFSGYISKPVHGPDLEKIILDFLPPDKIQHTSYEEALTQPTDTADTGDNILDQQLGLSICMGNKSFYHEILKAFLQSEFQNTLQNYYSNEDWKNYQIVAHGVKSAAKSIGATPLSELAKDMEFALKEQNNTEFIRSQHPVILQEIRKLETLIQEIIKTNQTTT